MVDREKSVKITSEMLAGINGMHDEPIHHWQSISQAERKEWERRSKLPENKGRHAFCLAWDQAYTVLSRGTFYYPDLVQPSYAKLFQIRKTRMNYRHAINYLPEADQIIVEYWNTLTDGEKKHWLLEVEFRNTNLNEVWAVAMDWASAGYNSHWRGYNGRFESDTRENPYPADYKGTPEQLDRWKHRKPKMIQISEINRVQQIYNETRQQATRICP